MKDSERLRSYPFKCPCCEKQHKRVFEYMAKFRGFIPEEESLEQYSEVSMLERAVMPESDEKRSIKVENEPIFRCGNCFEFFRFDDNVSEPRRLNEVEKRYAKAMFKPVDIPYERAAMNSVAFFDQLINKRGCSVDYCTGEIVLYGEDGETYRLDIGKELVKAFYDNPNFKVKTNHWVQTHQTYEEYEQANAKVNA